MYLSKKLLALNDVPTAFLTRFEYSSLDKITFNAMKPTPLLLILRTIKKIPEKHCSSFDGFLKCAAKGSDLHPELLYPKTRILKY